MSEQDLTRARTELSKDPEELETWADVLGICAEKLMYAGILAASGDESDQRRVARALAQASGALTATQLRVIELEHQISRMLGEEQEAIARELLDRVVSALGLDPEDPPTFEQTLDIIKGYAKQPVERVEESRDLTVPSTATVTIGEIEYVGYVTGYTRRGKGPRQLKVTVDPAEAVNP